MAAMNRAGPDGSFFQVSQVGMEAKHLDDPPLLPQGIKQSSRAQTGTRTGGQHRRGSVIHSTTVPAGSLGLDVSRKLCWGAWLPPAREGLLPKASSLLPQEGWRLGAWPEGRALSPLGALHPLRLSTALFLALLVECAHLLSSWFRQTLHCADV